MLYFNCRFPRVTSEFAMLEFFKTYNAVNRSVINLVAKKCCVIPVVVFFNIPFLSSFKPFGRSTFKTYVQKIKI